MHQVVKILSIGFINVKKVCKYVTILEEMVRCKSIRGLAFKKKSIRAAPVYRILEILREDTPTSEAVVHVALTLLYHSQY